MLMQSFAQSGRRAVLILAVVLPAACGGQKEPAHLLIADIESTVTAAAPEAAKYVPDELKEVQAQLGALHAAFDKQDYAAVVSGAPAVLGEAASLATAAAAKKDSILKAFNDEWTALAGSVPADAAAIQNRIEFLNKKSSKKLAAGIDLNAAAASAGDAASLWSKATAAFAAGNLAEAVSSAKQVKTRLEAVAAAIKLDLPAPTA